MEDRHVFLAAGEGFVFEGRNVRLLFTYSFYCCRGYNYVEFFHSETGKCSQINWQKTAERKQNGIFVERTLIRADFVHMLGNHF